VSRTPLDNEPSELVRRLAQEPVPTSPEDGSSARRDRLVRAMRDTVERTAEGAQRARRFRIGASLVAAAAVFALMGGLLLQARTTSSSVKAVVGLDGVVGTVVLTQDGKPHVVGPGERSLREGDGLQTAAGARAHLLTRKSSVNVGESTELRLLQPSPVEERISLKRGRVDVSVDKAVETKRSVVVETPDAEVVVRGTVFDVRVEPLEGATNTHVHVTRGSVWVLSQGVQVALLGAGQSWSSAGIKGDAARVLAPPQTQPEAGVELPSARSSRATSSKPAAVAGAAKEPTPRRAGTLADENRLYTAAVEAKNRGDAARAAELFGELIASFPQSPLRESAQVMRFRALKQAGLAARAASEARRYLAEHADGAARAEARDIALSGK
jgi:hypothetical protein